MKFILVKAQIFHGRVGERVLLSAGHEALMVLKFLPSFIEIIALENESCKSDSCAN